MNILKTVKAYFQYKNSVAYLCFMILACIGAFLIVRLNLGRGLTTALQTACYLVVFLMLQRIGAIVMDISKGEEEK
ncbi:MAG: hypothetical protein HFI31_11210 [Lachnospiraceae bacterium]|nr:hypothetical protein [Lachnospiraceae bacterium]